MSECPFLRRLRRSLEGCRFRLCLQLIMFEEQFCASLFGFLVPIPMLDHKVREPRGGMLERWGVYFDPDSIVFCWGDKSKRFWFPWMWDHCRTEVRRPDGSWVPYVASYDHDKEPDGREILTVPYRYTLKSGEVQEATATVYTERRTWRWRCLPWLPWPRKTRQSIDVAFNREIGERSGSWKGGCIGCGWDMKPGESMEESLRRMESERLFR